MKLYKAVYQESKRRQLTHWYAVLTKGIVNLLNRFGFSFEAIGDPVDYNGIRTPYMTEITKLEQDMEARNPELYEEFNKNL
jgi:N-acyl amino acid synthase of PEP-CTERM/exosortase system